MTSPIRIRTVLIANRGEIALRVMRACRAMGLRSVAVFSDADAGAPFVRAADRAVRIGPPPPAESYLSIPRLLEAARAAGADAIHPGYGFLSENADFAEACAGAGLTFIGPPAEAIRLLGSKVAARELAERAGVPVIPAFDPGQRDLPFPVLLKASAGGGGKGMRVVRSPAELDSAITSARREAMGAFGDDTLLVERYIERPRHVEIQILGDHHGRLVHLFERECSIQRRHQKIIEESPSPALTPELRERMGRAAVAIGAAAGYHSAGTVEFILAPDGAFYFLEVNTRLQVEHPVTELVTGIDLVREQIRIAQGEPLGYDQDDLTQSGAAIECRLYAENPDQDFLPTTGRVVDWHVPAQEGLRVDTGIETGSVVGIHYDPMLAKIICHAPSRAEAIARMERSLAGMAVQGLITNRELLLRVLEHPEFLAGNLDTHFLERHAADLAGGAPAPAARRLAATAAALAGHEARRAARRLLPGLEPGFRLAGPAEQRVGFVAGDERIEVRYANLGGRRFRVAVDGDEAAEVAVIEAEPPLLVIEEASGIRHRLRVVPDGDRHLVHGDDLALALIEEPRFPDRQAAAVAGGCVAPMPGRVAHIAVEVGAEVKRGDTLLVLEAMKMEHAVKAPDDGVVAALHVAEGDQVDADALLAVVASAEQA